MKKISKVSVSIDHITLSSDDRSMITLDSTILKKYKYGGRKRTYQEGPEPMAKTYEFFHEFKHKKTGNKLHIFIDRFNKDNYKTLYLPNLTLKFFSSWDHNLSYAEVVRVNNLFTDKYNVGFAVSEFHVAVDLYFKGKKNPIKQLAGLIKSGRKIGMKPSARYPHTYYSHSEASIYFMSAYDKTHQLKAEKAFQLSGKSLKDLDRYQVARLESRFNNTALGLVPSVEELASKDFSYIYPQYLKILRPDRDKLARRGFHPKEYKGKDLVDLRSMLREEGIVNNFIYYLKDYKRLSRPIRTALKVYRWERHPDKYPLSRPSVRIKPQKVQFIRH
ncbi:hypothetical protein DSCW_51980 [Desulfosarcina widdelii]|uniref:Replication-associated protein G2P N-terminal domain-containing protein n=1 Tax=Desulfosarcina widdelii TaxID=947919 RepID=A0A5K7ZDH7_9BACT|nr:hypothetical protein [Desulfosarcina widdelii]BBO77781.1 hypothetical protein DSCW_51980 [Desulfosarcina widdelii]